MKLKILYDLDRQEPRPFLLARLTVDRRRGFQRTYCIVDAFHEYVDAEKALPSYTSEHPNERRQ